MRTFANHHVDTPHGVSHAPISVSVLLTVLFVGAQWVMWVLFLITTPFREPTLYTGANTFTAISAVIALLLMAFLLVDLQRNRVEAHGGSKFQFAVFGVAVALLALFMVFLARVIWFTGPPV